jgi:hypothetical protein
MRIKNIVLAGFFILIATLSRTIFHVGPNFELVTAVSLLAGYFIKNKKIAVLVPLFTMFITDSIIGNSNIFLFTWSAYALAPVIGSVAKKLRGAKKIIKLAALEVGGILSVIVFFLWTNLGVVIVCNMYPKTLDGVISSYINGLPFVKPQLVSTIFLLPVLYVATLLISKIAMRFETKLGTKQIIVDQIHTA